jgi:hypothetical protein
LTFEEQHISATAEMHFRFPGCPTKEVRLRYQAVFPIALLLVSRKNTGTKIST